jgi:hypothetical protein
MAVAIDPDHAVPADLAAALDGGDVRAAAAAGSSASG